MVTDRPGQSVDIPQSFGEYQLVERLAVGGMAEIFLAKTTGIGGFEKTLVIKRLHERHSRDDDFIDMLVDEAKIAVQLNHPNIGKVFDLGRIRDRYYIAMEYIEGPDLGRVLEYLEGRGDRLPIPAVLYVAGECCSALDYAHERTDDRGRPLGIVHRDVSPPNIMLGKEGEVKLVDFGIAKARQRVQETRQGAIKGKFYYMAPEQARGGRVDPRTDIFSVGMVIYEAIAGEHPYIEVPEGQMVEAARAADVPPLRQYRKKLDPELERIVMRALRPAPDERYSSAEEFDQTLADYRERKCDPFDRRRLSSLVVDLWPQMEGQAGRGAPPAVDTGTMSPDEFEATESSIILAPEDIGAELTEDQPDVFGEASLDDDAADGEFDEEAPTEVWDGGDGGAESAGAPGGEAVAGVDDESLPPPPDDEMEFDVSEEPETVDSEGSGGDWTEDVASGTVEIGESSEQDEEPKRATPDDRPRTTERGRPGGGLIESLAGISARLERAGISRTAQMFSAVLLAVGLFASVGITGYAVLSTSPETKQLGAGGTPAEGDDGSSKDRRVELQVDSEPPGATVTVDGKGEGQTPQTLTGLRPDESYEIVLEAEGHKEVERTVRPGDVDGAFTVELEPYKGVLQVSTAPSGAEIELDGESIGESTVTAENVSRDDTHELVARHDGEKVEKTVEWSDADGVLKEVELEFESERRRRARQVRRNRRRARGTGSSGSGGGASTDDEGGSDSSGGGFDLYDDSDESGGSDDDGGTGYISVQVRQGWGKVYIDGKQVASETPLIRHSVSSGSHRVKVTYPKTGGSGVQTVNVGAGAHERVIFDP